MISFTPWVEAALPDHDSTFTTTATGETAPARRLAAETHAAQLLAKLNRNRRPSALIRETVYAEKDGQLIATVTIWLPPNPRRLTVAKALENEGYETMDEFLASSAAQDSVVFACCDEGCQVEPDGRCEHGCPSILVAMGVI